MDVVSGAVELPVTMRAWGAPLSSATTGGEDKGQDRVPWVSYLKTVRTSRAETRVRSDSEYPTV